MRDTYLSLAMSFERLHRLFLEVIKDAVEPFATRDLTHVQALVLYNIGPLEVTVGDITSRGYYLGSNVSYNLRKMVQNEYLIQKQSKNDKRSFFVLLSPKGKKIFDRMEKIFQEHKTSLQKNGLSDSMLVAALDHMKTLENFWLHKTLHGRSRPV